LGANISVNSFVTSLQAHRRGWEENRGRKRRHWVQNKQKKILAISEIRGSVLLWDTGASNSVGFSYVHRIWKIEVTLWCVLAVIRDEILHWDSSTSATANFPLSHLYSQWW